MVIKQPIIALLPPFNYYTELTIEADKFAVRLSCQIDNKIRGNRDFVFFDEHIDKYLAQRHNEKAVSESLNHSIVNGRDCSKYKELSLVDIDHAGIYCSVFLHCYHEALAFLSLVDQFKPSKIIISADDPNRDIFDELAGQMVIETDIVQSFGRVDKDKTDLIKRSNRALDIQEFDWHHSLKQPMWKHGITAAFNYWSKLVRIIMGKKPFVYTDHYGQLSGIRAYLSKQKNYYPIFFRLIKLPVINLLSSGFLVLQMGDAPHKNNEVSEIIKNYKEHLKIIKDEKAIGQIEFKDKKYSIAGSIIHRLHKNVTHAFKQIADNVDIYEDFINKNKVNGALLSSDINWENRMIVRLFQKHRLRNMVLMNGWYGAKHTVENKSVNKVLCFGDSYINNYFKDKKNVKITGSPKFDAAFAKRALIKPKYPIRKILLSTFTFSPADINCRYSDSEKYLNDVLATIKKYGTKNNHKLHIAIRPHPSDFLEFYRWYLEKSGFPGIELKPAGDFQEIVSNYDLFIASYSTTIFEAAAMEIPVMFYHPCNQVLYPPFDGSCSELPAAFSLEDFERIFAMVMENGNYAYKFTDTKALKPYVGEMDGNSTSIIINEVVKMAEGK